MTIAVTGATGALGRLVIDELLSTQPAENIVAVVRNAAKAADLADKGVQIRVADYTDQEALGRALTGVRKLLLVSGSEVGQRIPQHGNVVAAALTAGVGHIAYTSVLAAETTPLLLAPEHKATEELIRASGIPFTFLRNGWYTENYLQAVQLAGRTGAITAAAGTGRVASATRADYAAAAAAVLTGEGHEGKSYELSGDRAWDYHELAAAAGDILAQEIGYNPVSTGELVEILTASGLDEGLAGFLAALDADISLNLLAPTSGELAALIGRPTTPLVAGLKAALQN